MLATLDFNPAKDADGNDITFRATFASGMTMYVRVVPVRSCLDVFSHPNPFPCRLTPRPHIGKEVLERVLI